MDNLNMVHQGTFSNIVLFTLVTFVSRRSIFLSSFSFFNSSFVLMDW
eukprot:08404.XXX_382629_382769_1 [CDS] Oithona nana genome sequencing.